MTYLVTGMRPATTNAARAEELHVIVDTLAEGRERAAALLKSGHTQIALWQQVATPSIKQVVYWSDQQSDTRNEKGSSDETY